MSPTNIDLMFTAVGIIFLGLSAWIVVGVLAAPRRKENHDDQA
jgi:hypothetical protein